MWKKVLRRGGIGIGVILALWWLLVPWKWPIPIDAETTWVTEPPDGEGGIDYAAALNERNGVGVTADNNAAVLLWRAMGLFAGPKSRPPEMFKGLGIEPPAPEGDYFVDFDRSEFHADAAPDALKLSLSMPWKAAVLPEVAAWLGRYEKHLALASEASRRPRFHIPLFPEAGVGTAALRQARVGEPLGIELFRALLSRGLLRAGEGDDAGAWADLMACHRLGRLTTQGCRPADFMGGIQLQSAASRTTLQYLRHVAPDAGALAAHLADLLNLPPQADLADKVDVTERLVLLDALQSVHRQGVPDLSPHAVGGVCDFRDTMRSANGYLSDMAGAMRADTGADRADRLEAIRNRHRNGYTAAHHWTAYVGWLVGGPVIRGRDVGRIYLNMMLPDALAIQVKADRARQEHELLVIAFALEWHRKTHGQYPERLDALTPRPLPKLPPDVFSGGQLVYRREGEGHLLYGVGPNGKDDGGTGKDQGGDDIVLRMPKDEPPPPLKGDGGVPGTGFPPR